jgi:uncharacterized membrane protein
MVTLITNFANLLCASLLVGAMFGAQLFLNPAGLTAPSYILVQQQGIRRFNTTLPALGAATILLTVSAAILARTDSRRVYLLSAAAVCFIAAGLVTRFLNQPLNAVVMTWRPETYPSDWTTLRDEWWRGHIVRLASGLLGLSLVIAASLMRE